MCVCGHVPCALIAVLSGALLSDTGQTEWELQLYRCTHICVGPFPARRRQAPRSAAAAKIQGMQPMALLSKMQTPRRGRRLLNLICRLRPRLHLLRYSVKGMALASCNDLCRNITSASRHPPAHQGNLCTQTPITTPSVAPVDAGLLCRWILMLTSLQRRCK